MQAKLGAGFLMVALLYVLLGLGVPRLGLRPPADTIMLVSSYIVVGLGAAWLISFVLSRRLRELARAASVISRGNLTRRLETGGKDETAELARSRRRSPRRRARSLEAPRSRRIRFCAPRKRHAS